MAQIFVSHIKDDESIAEEIAIALEDAGFSTWYYERDSYPGRDYLDQVSNAIEECDVVMVVLSPDSISSRQVEDEVKWAREQRKSLLPMLHRMTWSQFQGSSVRWKMAVGIAAAISLSPDLTSVMPRIIKGLENLGLEPMAEIEEVDDSPECEDEDATSDTDQELEEVSDEEPSVRSPLVSHTYFKVILHEVCRLQADDDEIRAVALSGDGRLAVSASQNKTEKGILRVWDVATGREVRSVESDDFIQGLAVSRDGKIAVSACFGCPQVWDLDSGAVLRTLVGHRADVWSVALSRDGRTAISSSDDQKVKVWDVDSGRERCSVWSPTDHGRPLALSGDGSRAASPCGYDQIKIWRVYDGSEVVRLAIAAKSIALNEDGQVAVSLSSEGRKLQLWNIEMETTARAFRDNSSSTSRVAVSDDGRIVVSLDWSSFQVWDAATGLKIAEWESEERLADYGVSVDAQTIAVLDDTGVITILRATEL